MPSTFFRFILQHKYLVVAITLLYVVLAASGMRFLVFNNDYQVFFSEENPQLLAFKALQDTYTKNDNILFVVSAKDGPIFTRETLAAIEWLTKEAWQVPYSLRVDSITNFQHTYAEEDDLIVEDLVLDAAGLSDAQLADKRRIALAEPMLLDRLISPDANTTGINVTIQMPGVRLDETPEVVQFSRNLKEQMKTLFPQVEVRLTGVVMMDNAFAEASQQDMQTLYPCMLLLVLIVMGVLLRSIPATLSTLAVILMMIAATMGITGWIGIQMTAPTTIVPVIILTLAVADCVHVLTTFLHQMGQGKNKQDAMLESLRINLEPIFLTSLTTAIGFLILNLSDVPPFQDLGNMAAIGVAFAFILSITFLPALMMIMPVKAFRSDTPDAIAMARIAEFVIRNHSKLLVGMLCLVLFLLAQIPRNELNDEYVKYFDTSIEFRQDVDFVTERLGGEYRIDYSLSAVEAGGISDPAFLRHLDAFAEWYRQQPKVVHVSSFTDIMKRLNKNLHGDDPAWYRLPDQRDLAAQYLLLYEFSLPFGLDLNNQINVKKSAVRFSVTIKPMSTNELLALEERAQQWLQENVPETMRSEGASPTVMFSHIGARNIRTMLKASVIALVLISFILMLVLRSVRIGLISIVPNLIPIGMAFGIWGLFVGQVGLALSVVSSMTLGIVVDDTVHFLSKYLRARREKGLNSEDAVRYAFATVGTALWVTSVVLVLGFGMLAFSSFELNSGMGLLTAITIALALMADFLFLPPLLMKYGGPNEKNRLPAA
ncbi:Predicted exporter of the RND superfamily [hydrothermal vent metagenome]|uniref:Predicted exporter of the RND superfamily n=1 Tax=hydrothermal vent metagenome TaxID=652676 RepID=A0A3B1BRX5_9ZZZZ